MDDLASKRELIVPVAIGLLAAVTFVGVMLKFLSFGKPRGAAADPVEGGQSGATPPGWVTSDATPTESMQKFSLGPGALLQAQQMKASSAPVEDICHALHIGFGDMGETKQKILRAMLESALSGKSGLSFSADVQVNTSGTHDSFHMDEKSLAQAQSLHAGGATVEDICRALKPDYAELDPARQERFKHVMSNLLRLGGIHVQDMTP